MILDLSNVSIFYKIIIKMIFLKLFSKLICIYQNMPVYIPVKGAVNENAKGRVIGMKDNNFGYSIELQEGAKQVRRVFGGMRNLSIIINFILL